MIKKNVIAICVALLGVCGCGVKENDIENNAILEDKEEMVAETSETTEIVFGETNLTEANIEEKNNITEDTKDGKKSKVVYFENPYLVDYMMIANYYKKLDAKNYDGIPEIGSDDLSMLVTGYELLDIDYDGNLELLMNGMVSNQDKRSAMFVFDSDLGTYSIWRDTSAAGDARICVDDANKQTYIYKSYATKYSYLAYNTWSKDGWKPSALFEKDGDDILNSNWFGSEVSQEEWYENSKNLSASLRELDNKLYDNLVLRTNANPQTVAETLISYYDNKKIKAYLVETGNSSEYYVVVTKYFTSMWNKQVNEDVSDHINFTALQGSNSCVLVIRGDDKGASIVSQDIDESDITDVKYDNGLVVVSSGTEYKYNVNGEELVADKKDNDKRDNDKKEASASAQKGNDDWKNVYIDFIKVNLASDETGGVKVAFVDLDGDGVREMIYKRECGPMGTAGIYSCAKNEIIDLNMMISPKTELIWNGSQLISVGYPFGTGLPTGISIFEKVNNQMINVEGVRCDGTSGEVIITCDSQEGEEFRLDETVDFFESYGIIIEASSLGVGNELFCSVKPMPGRAKKLLEKEYSSDEILDILEKDMDELIVN